MNKEKHECMKKSETGYFWIGYFTSDTEMEKTEAEYSSFEGNGWYLITVYESLKVNYCPNCGKKFSGDTP